MFEAGMNTLILILGMLSASAFAADEKPTPDAQKPSDPSQQKTVHAPKPQSPEEESPSVSPGVQRTWQFGLGLSYALRTYLKFDSVVIDGSPGYSGEFEYTNSFSITADARWTAPNSWGFIGGITFDGERKFDSGTISAGGGVSFRLYAGENPSKLRTGVVYASAVYRWERIYLPFGVNVSWARFTPGRDSDISTNGSTADVSTSGGIGGQLGVGYYITPKFVVEGESRGAAVKLKATTPSSTTDFGRGLLYSLQVTAKYFF